MGKRHLFIMLYSLLGLGLILAFGSGCSNLYKDVHDLQSSQEAQNSQLTAHERELRLLRIFIADTSTALHLAINQQASVQAAIAGLQSDLYANQEAITQLNNLMALYSGNQTLLQSNLNELQAELAAVHGHSISNIIDPCSDTVGKIDEVLLRLTNGKILASLSDSQGGHNTRFVILPNGSYTTTDGTGCAFVVLNGVVSW